MPGKPKAIDVYRVWSGDLVDDEPDAMMEVALEALQAKAVMEHPRTTAHNRHVAFILREGLKYSASIDSYTWAEAFAELYGGEE